jgi:hypothetical protein
MANQAAGEPPMMHYYLLWVSIFVAAAEAQQLPAPPERCALRLRDVRSDLLETAC